MENLNSSQPARRPLRAALIPAALGAVSLVAAACGSSGGAKAASGATRPSVASSVTKSVSMAYAQDNLSFGSSELAWKALQSQGWGIKVSYLASPSLSLEAAANGSVDLAETNPIAALSAIYHGESLVIVGTMTNPSDFVLVTPSNINSVSQLNGKVIAVNSPASLSNAVVQNLVQTQHLNSKVVDIEGGSNRDHALEAGRVSAVSVFLADGVILQNAGSFHVLKNFQGYPIPDQILVANKSWAESHASTLTAVLEQMIKTNKSFVSNPGAEVSTLQTMYPKDSSNVVKQWTLQAAADGVPSQNMGGSNVSEVTNWASYLKSIKLLPAALPTTGSSYAFFSPLAAALKAA